jgi:pSer/pThr/pTyr-binding forkhead associated (FHA) protein
MSGWLKTVHRTASVRASEGSAAVAPKGRIEIQNGGFEGMTFELVSAETLIGRNPTTDITLLDEGISREHAVILLDEDAGGYNIEDLQSTNGTKVNGKRVRSALLSNGDVIELGRTRFEFILLD